MATSPAPATNAAEPQSRTEVEIRDWYSKAERGDLVSPEETQAALDDLIKIKNQ